MVSQLLFAYNLWKYELISDCVWPLSPENFPYYTQYIFFVFNGNKLILDLDSESTSLSIEYVEVRTDL